MKVFFNFLFLFFSILSIAQSRLKADNGMIDIAVKIVDTETNIVLPLAIYQVKQNDSLIFHSIADFDGRISMQLCPQIVLNNTLEIKILMAGYFEKEFSVSISSDTLLVIGLKNNPMEITTRKRQNELRRLNGSYTCGLIDPPIFERDIYYEHCDGRVLKEQDIDSIALKSGQWKSLKNENYLIPIYTKTEFYLSDSLCFITPKSDTIIPYGKYLPHYYTKMIKNYCYVILKENGTQRTIAIDNFGNELFDMYVFDNGPDYLECGRFRIVKNGKVGFANEKGEIIIEPQYECADYFRNGKAMVTYNCALEPDGEYHDMVSNTWFYIDIFGNRVDE